METLFAYIDILLDEIKHKKLTALDEEIIFELKNELINNFKINYNQNVYKKTIVSLIRDNPNLEKIIIDTLTDNLFEEFIGSKQTQFIHSVCKKIQSYSKCFDIILQFENDKKINVHSILLKNIDYFKFITDNLDSIDEKINKNENKIKEKVNLNYDFVKSLTNYLYEGLCEKNYAYYDEISIEYLLFLDSLCINLPLYMNWCCNHCVKYIYRYIGDCFAQNNFDNFLHKISILVDILVRLGYNVNAGIIEWFVKNKDKYCMKSLSKNPFFSKECVIFLKWNTTFGYELVVDTKCFDLYGAIAKESNVELLLASLIKYRPPNYWDVIVEFYNKFPHIFNNYYKQEIMMGEIAGHSRSYDLSSVDNGFFSLFLIKNGTYDKLNNLVNISEYELEFLINMMAKTLNDNNWEYLKQVVDNHKIHKNLKIVYNKNIDITNYSRFVHVNLLHPLKFNSYVDIGCVKNILYDYNGRINGVCIIIAVYKEWIKVGGTIRFGKYYDDGKKLIINKLSRNNGVDHSIDQFYLSKDDYDEINIIFGNTNSEQFNVDIKIKKDMSVFYENYVC
jgi:hypothetical protein